MNSRRRSSNIVIEKMARRHHAVAGAVQNIKIFQLAVERVRPFDRKQSGRKPAIEPPAFQVTGEIGSTLDHHEAAVRTARELMQTPRLIQRPLRQAVPGCRRPAIHHRQPENVIVLVFIALDVQPVRTLRGQREHLQCNIAVRQARNVHLSVGAALQQIPSPQKRIGVKIGDGELLVQIQRSLGCRVGRLLHQLVLVLVHQLRDLHEERGRDT